jgi:DNA-binding NtrC family response regulator
MAEPEAPENISARKLVLETAKFNVITAYSVKECLELVDKFPKIEAVILHSALNGIPCDQTVAQIKERRPGLAVVVLATTEWVRCKSADHLITSHEPQELLTLLRSEFGDPREELPGQRSVG